MKKYVNINLGYRDGILIKSRLNIPKSVITDMNVTEEDRKVKITYKNNEIIIEKINKEVVKKIEIKDEKIVNYVAQGLITFNKQKNITYAVQVPTIIIKELNLESDNELEMTIKNKKIYLKKENKLFNGKIITIKVNKGGIGKTFLSVQIGAGLALLRKKVLLLTSDSQNNILDYSFNPNKIPDFSTGLKEFVKGGTGEIIEIRKNLEFIPLENSKFSSQFLEKLPLFLEEKRKEYDYIIIDSIPTMSLDTVFVHCSDKIIVPCYCDRVTVEGALNVVDEAGVEKIHSIIVNRYRETEVQKMFMKTLKNSIDETSIFLPKPIKEISQIEKLLEKGRTIWESQNKTIIEVQDIIMEVISKLEN